MWQRRGAEREERGGSPGSGPAAPARTPSRRAGCPGPPSPAVRRGAAAVRAARRTPAPGGDWAGRERGSVLCGTVSLNITRESRVWSGCGQPSGPRGPRSSRRAGGALPPRGSAVTGDGREQPQRPRSRRAGKRRGHEPAKVAPPGRALSRGGTGSPRREGAPGGAAPRCAAVCLPPRPGGGRGARLEPGTISRCRVGIETARIRV